MFDSIYGHLALREPTRVVVEAGGLGYEIHVPLGTYEALPAAGESARLLLHVVMRDDEWRLFGFGTKDERDVFRALLRVGGVGPMIALGLLSGLKPDELSQAVTAGDVRALTRVKGVGKKTAERIIVELKDVLKSGPGGEASASVPAVEEGPQADAVAALLALGFDPGDASRRVTKAASTHSGADVSALVRAAIRGA